MSWHLNRALTNLRDEVNATWPKRDRTSDGTIGDAAHQATSSDHNPDPDGSVDAWDMDVDGVDVEHIKERFEKHEASRYWIHNRKIASRPDGYDPKTDGRWPVEPYSGANPHDKHVHFNTREAYEDSAEPWGIGDDMAVTPEEQAEIAAKTWSSEWDDGKPGDPGGGRDNAGQRLREARDHAKRSADNTVTILANMQTPVPVVVDAAAVAAALIADPTFIPAIAAAVNDDAAQRLVD